MTFAMWVFWMVVALVYCFVGLLVGLGISMIYFKLTIKECGLESRFLEAEPYPISKKEMQGIKDNLKKNTKWYHQLSVVIFSWPLHVFFLYRNWHRVKEFESLEDNSDE